MHLGKHGRVDSSLKMPKSQERALEAMGLWDMSIEEFDDIDEEQEFSERYKRKKRRMMTGLRQIEEQRQQEQVHHFGVGRTKSWIYRVAVVMLVALLIPASVYAVAKLYELSVTNKKHETQVSISMDSDNTEEYTAVEVRTKQDNGITEIADRIPLKVTLDYVPKECIYYDDYKYYGKDESGVYGISMFMILGDFSEQYVQNVKYSIASEKRRVNELEYVVVTLDETFTYNKRVFVPLLQWGVVLDMYVGEGISIEELDKIVAGIKVEKAVDMAEAIPGALCYLEDETDEDSTEEDEPIIIPKKNASYRVGDTVKQEDMDITVDQVELYDSIADFSKDNFSGVSDIYIKDGDLTSGYNRALLVPGDGVNSVNRYEQKTKMVQKFVYITLTFKTGSVAVSDYYVNNMGSCFLACNETGDYEYDSFACYLTNLDHKTAANFNEFIYFDHSLEGNQSKGFFNMGTIPANSEITVHVGLLIDEDMLDRLYLHVPDNRYGGCESIGKAWSYIKLVE